MTCELCQSKLTALLHGEYENELQMHEHLAECDSCRQHYIDLVEDHALINLSMNSSGRVRSSKLKPLVGLFIGFGIAACLSIIFFVKSKPEAQEVAKAYSLKGEPERAELMKDSPQEPALTVPSTMRIATDENAVQLEEHTEMLRKDMKEKKAISRAAPKSFSGEAFEVMAAMKKEDVTSLTILEFKRLLDEWLKGQPSEIRENLTKAFMNVEGILINEKDRSPVGIEYSIEVQNKDGKGIDYGTFIIHNGAIIKFTQANN
jgi:biopolymer transport protein ExbD